ncbi:hypothetical protein ACEWY4_001879 [Coilia grayii]|uniref:C-type lectin domain-containing protein n=1 Tax=Coilia grayii TaxID=363190 RepID=A0ABD1KUN2_9TELE
MSLLSGNITVELDRLRTAVVFMENEKIAWNESQKNCREWFTDLVTIYDNDDNKKLEEHPLGSSNGAFFGLTQGNQANKWSNGEPYSYNKTHTENNDFCFQMMQNGEWDSVNCKEEKAFICYSDEPFSPFMYHPCEEKKTWKAAQNYCITHNMTDLVSIGNEEENSAVKSAAKRSGLNIPFWIGLMRDSWEWSDKGGSAFRKWSTGVGNGPNAIMIDSWYTGPANTLKNNFICYKAHINISEERMTWEEALDYCDKHDGFLSIEDSKEQRVVEAFLSRYEVNEPVWIGLLQNGLLGYWVWTRGYTVKWAYWKDRQKPRLPLSHPCGALLTKKHHFWWTDMNCQSKLRALCFDQQSKCHVNKNL